jgi:hypothetical protein
VSAAPGGERKGAEAAAEQIRRRFPGACLVTVFLPGLPSLQSESAIDTIPGANKAAISLGEAVQICLDWLQERTGT